MLGENLIESTEIRLTSKEIESIAEFAKNHMHEDAEYHNFKIVSTAGPIASCTTIICEHCQEEQNITDYDSW